MRPLSSEPVKPPNCGTGFQPVKRGPSRLRALGALLVLVVLVIAAGWAYRHYTEPERIRALAEAYLREQVNGQVKVGSATFSWFEGVRLFDVTIETGFDEEGAAAASEGGGLSSTLFRCREVEVTHDALSLLWGKLRIQSIIAHQPHCSIVRDVVLGKSNLSEVLRFRLPDSPGVPACLPAVELRDARLSVVERRATHERKVEDLTLTVRGRPAQDDPLVYDIVWQERDNEASGHSRIDLDDGSLHNVHGGLPWMSIEAVMIIVDAGYDGAGGWCDLLGLDGTVRAKDYELNSNAGPERKRSATVDLHQASLSIPINKQEEALDRDGRYLCFEQVNGTVRVTEDALHAAFSGLFHGSSCEVLAVIRGGKDDIHSLDDVDITAEISLSGLTLPKAGPAAPLPQARLIDRWRLLKATYERYDPSGVIDLHMSLAKKAGVDEPIVLNKAHLVIRDGSICAVYFPYAVECVSGMIEYTPDGVYIEHLSGLHDHGSVTMSGHLKHPAGRAEAMLYISGMGIPLDNDLRDALPDKQRAVWDRFNPTGVADVDVLVVRSEQTDQDPGRWQPYIRAGFENLSASYVGFLYPLEEIAGSLSIEPGLFEMEVAGRRGPTRAEVVGRVTSAGGTVTDASFHIDGWDIPIDDVLRAALPEKPRKQVDAFHPVGRFDADIDLQWDAAAGSLEPSGNVCLSGVTVRPDRLPVVIENLNGSLRIGPRRIDVEGVEGRYRDATVSVTGYRDSTDGESQSEFSISCDQLRVDDALLEALPAPLQETLATWRIDGPISTETTLRYASRDGDKLPRIRTVAKLAGVTVRHPRFPSALEDVHGEITVDESGLQATGLTARYDGAQIESDITITRHDGAEQGEIRLTASGLRLSSTLRDALPEQARDLWDRLAPTGVVDLALERLCWKHEKVGYHPPYATHRPFPEAAPVWTVDGKATLHEVALSDVVGLGDVSGTITGSGMLVDPRGGTMLRGRLDLGSAEFLGYRITGVESEWSLIRDASDQGRFELAEATGDFYKGMLIADLEVRFDNKRTTYDLRATAREVELRRFLQAGAGGLTTRDKPIEASGWVNAQLSLSGEIGRLRSREGMGGFEILDGRMCRLPIVFAILNVINPTTPLDEKAFKYARANFFVTGRRMDLRDILLQGPALTLAGSGNLSLADWHVDLQLEPVSGRQWIRVPIVTDIIKGATRSLGGLQVTGPLSQPVVTPLSIGEANKTIKSLFQKKKSDKIRPTSSRQPDETDPRP